MKRILTLILALSILVTALISCSDSEEVEKGSVNVFVEQNHDVVIEKLLTGEIEVAVLPEPKATTAINKGKQADISLSVKLNISEEWDKVSETVLPMGCIVVKNEFLNAHEGAIVEFLKEYKASIEYIGNSLNNESAANMIVSAGILPQIPVAKSALKNLYGSIVYKDSADMKAALVGFYDAIGLSQPSDEFYYTPSASAAADSTTVKIGVMNGPTGMGMAKLINDYGKESSKYVFETFSDPEQAKAKLLNGELDVVCLPTNNAAALANEKSNYISVAAINCLGSLYVVAKDDVEINSISDLKDKKVYYGVKNSTTEPILKYIVENNDLKLNVVE